MHGVCRRVLLAASVASVVFAGQASAAGDPVADRRAAMKQLGLQMRDVTPYSNGKAAYDPAKVKVLMTGLAANAKRLQGLFPASSATDPQSKALPAVWQKRADFDKRMAEVVKAATTAQNAQTLEAFKPAYATLATSCKGCHDAYRKPN
jgi:cytochrome c556